MKTKKFLPFFLALGFLFLGQFSVQAQEAADVNKKSNMVLIATVDIFDAKITSQNGNVFNISFDLHNEQKIQPQVIYGVELIKIKQKEGPLPTIKIGGETLQVMDQAEEYQLVADQEIFSNDIVSLNAGETLHKEITYTAPSSLSGKYELRLKAQNSEGTILGVYPLGDVTLESSPNSLLIDESSCRISIGDNNSKEYRPQSGGIGVDPGSVLRMRCNIENKSNASSQNITPEITIYHRSVFGKVVDTQKLEVFTLTSNEKSSKEFTLRVPDQSQNYEGIFTLTDNKGNKISNKVDLIFGVNGESSMIENVLLDKDSYSKGETAKLQVWYLINGGSAEGSNVNILIKDGKGSACSQQLSKKQEAKQQSDYSIEITKDCQNPVAEVVIKNKDGKVLAQNSFAVETKNEKANQEQKQAPKSNLGQKAFILGIILALVLIGLLGYLFSKRKGLIVFLGLLFAGSLFFASQASAATYTSPYGYQVVEGFYDMPNGQPYYSEEQTMKFMQTIYFNWPSGETHRVDSYSRYENHYVGDRYEAGWPGTLKHYYTTVFPNSYSWKAGGTSLQRTVDLVAPACRTGSSTGPLCAHAKVPRADWAAVPCYGCGSYPYPSKKGGFFYVWSSFFYHDTLNSDTLEEDGMSHTIFQVKNPICGCSSGTCNIAGSCPTLDPVTTQPTASCSFGTVYDFTWNATTSSYCWKCAGQDYTAGSPSCCVPRIINGSCGTANGGYFTSAPTSNLCSAGNQSGVSGSGPWSWTCSGINGGTTASCSANLCTCSAAENANYCSGTTYTNSCYAVCTGTKTCVPAPSLTFSANPSAIAYNGSSTLSWTVANATSCTASGDWGGAKNATAGTYTESTGNLTATKNYGLACVNSVDVSTGVKNVSVSVGSAPPASFTFKADPTAVASGGEAKLIWTTTNAASCYADGGDWTGWKDKNGGEELTGSLTSPKTYTLNCVNEVGASPGPQTVTVGIIGPPTLTFTANPESVTSGTAANLIWTVADADSCTASGDWGGAKNATAGTYTESTGSLTAAENNYTLTCTNVAGSTPANATVRVCDPSYSCYNPIPECPANFTGNVDGNVSCSEICTGSSVNVSFCGSGCVASTKTCSSGGGGGDWIWTEVKP